jgi:hypothetical protein
VELDIFSGRPNPTWTLSGEETSQLLALLANLPSKEAGWPASGLGYRGFVVSFRDPQDRVVTVRIHGGTVERSVGVVRVFRGQGPEAGELAPGNERLQAES